MFNGVKHHSSKIVCMAQGLASVQSSKSKEARTNTSFLEMVIFRPALRKSCNHRVVHVRSKSRADTN